MSFPNAFIGNPVTTCYFSGFPLKTCGNDMWWFTEYLQLNSVIKNCNNMIVFLEQIREIYTEKPTVAINSNKIVEDETGIKLTEGNKIYILCEEMIKGYNADRIKTLNLLRA